MTSSLHRRLLDIPPTVPHGFDGIVPAVDQGQVEVFRDPFADFTPSGR